jgi:hypothetical protein
MMSDKKLYLVETVSMFRIRYVIEAEDESHALDEVTYRTTGGGIELTEFSQKHIDEVIVSSRKISNKSYLKLFDKDNDYITSWTNDEKRICINRIDYEEDSNNR